MFDGIMGGAMLSGTMYQMDAQQRQREAIDRAAAQYATEQMFTGNHGSIIDGECERVEIKSIGGGSGD